MRRKYNLVVRYFCLFLTLLLTITSTSAFALNFPAGKEDLYIQNNILFYEPGVETKNFNEIINYSSVAGNIACTDGTRNAWMATPYNLTDEEIRGLIRVAMGENGKDGLDFELSLMANLYDSNQSSYSSVADYVLHSGWFADTTVANYNSDKYEQEVVQYFGLASTIFREGKRGLPAAVKNHDCIYCGEKVWVSKVTNKTSDAKKALLGQSYPRYDVIGIEQLEGDRKKVIIGRQDGTGHLLDGVSQEDIDYVKDRSNYIPNKTKVYTTYGSEDIFYAFPAPNKDPFYYKEGSLIADPVQIPCSEVAYLAPAVVPQIDLGSIPTDSLLKIEGVDSSSVRNKRLQSLFPDKKISSEGVVQGANGDITESEMQSYLTTVEVERKNKGKIEKVTLRVHKTIAPILPQLFKTIADAGFEIDQSYAFEHRHMVGDYSYLLSHHSYGTAIDINWDNNPYYSTDCKPYTVGATGTICYDLKNPKAVPIWVANIFTSYGFRWLGDHNKEGRSYDPMHFSYSYR